MAEGGDVARKPSVNETKQTTPRAKRPASLASKPDAKTVKANQTPEKEPTSFRQYTTEEIIKAIIKADGLVSVAARILKCGRATIYARRAEPAIAEAIEQARYYAIDNAEEALHDLVEAREPAAVFFMLKTLGKSRGYIERQEVTGADGAPQETVITVRYQKKPLPEAD